MSNKYIPELDTGSIPEPLSHVWYWFLQLNSQRTSNGFGINPITNQDMWFFFQLENIEPEPWEVNLIRRFDRVALEVNSKQQTQENNQNKSKK
jgi:hypothetical protein